MLCTILGILVLALIVFAFVASRQPAEFRVSRSTMITATPEKVFPHVNELRLWEAWSPWARLDPSAKSTFEGPASGTGAIMRWNGNNKVGAGSMTITDSKPNEMVRFRLDFLKPMRATNTAEFSFQPQGSQTQVTWSMVGNNNFIGKAMNLVLNCEKMCGDQFEKGLTNIKAVVEGK